MSKHMLGNAVSKLVALPSETLGIVCDLLEKLSDPIWIKALKKFLRKENPWETPNFPIWKTIKLGTHSNIRSLRMAIEDANMIVRESFCDIMFKPAIQISQKKSVIELVTATVAELGFSNHARYENICIRIRELGYDLCPAEVGPQLRLQYPNQSSGDFLYMAMKSIFNSRDELMLFGIGHDGDGCCLYARLGGPNSVWNLNSRFVFIRLSTK